MFQNARSENGKIIHELEQLLERLKKQASQQRALDAYTQAAPVRKISVPQKIGTDPTDKEVKNHILQELHRSITIPKLDNGSYEKVVCHDEHLCLQVIVLRQLYGREVYINVLKKPELLHHLLSDVHLTIAWSTQRIESIAGHQGCFRFMLEDGRAENHEQFTVIPQVQQGTEGR